MSNDTVDVDFDAVRTRIGRDSEQYKPAEWARKIGVSKNVVTNIHGATQQRPSFGYIISVSIFTGKPVDHYLWGTQTDDPQISKLLKRTSGVLNSGNEEAIKTLERNISYLEHTIEKEQKQQEENEAIRKELAELKKQKCEDGKHCPGEPSQDEKAA